MLKVFAEEFFSLKTIVLISLLGILYIILPGMLINYRLIFATAMQQYSLSYKFSILSLFIQWPFFNMQLPEMILLIVNALLVGINIVLIGKTITKLQHGGKIQFSVGSAAMIGFVTTGCTTCGLSILSILGVSASFSFLPFHGTELRLFAILLLLFSCGYMLKQLYQAKYCKKVSRK